MLIGGPLLVKHSAAKAAAKKVGSPSPVGSRLDILIVTDGSVHPQPIDLPSDAALQELDVHFAVRVAEGNRVRWTFPDITDATQALKIAAAGASSPVDAGTHVARPDADQVMVLVADGSPLVTDRPQLLPEVTPSADPDHWERIAKSANVRGTPVFALLQTRADGQLEKWRDFVPGGSARSLQALGSPTVIDAAFRLALTTSDDDYLLAQLYRPILLFDSKEPVPRPLSIEALFSTAARSASATTTVRWPASARPRTRATL